MIATTTTFPVWASMEPLYSGSIADPVTSAPPAAFDYKGGLNCAQYATHAWYCELVILHRHTHKHTESNANLETSAVPMEK